MQRARDRHRVIRPRRSRAGILCLGALREILVISIAATIVLAALSNAKTVFRLASLSQDQRMPEGDFHPVLNLGIDRDKNSLIVHSWPGEFDEIPLGPGKATRRQSPRFLISAATSETNSTSILLSQWADDAQVNHEIFIIRDDELVLVEKLELGTSVTAHVHISADGSLAMAVTDEGRVVGCDLTTSELGRWEFHLCGSAATTSLSPDGRQLLVANADHQMMICDARTGHQRIAVPGILQSHRNVTWTKDARRVAVASMAGDISVFDTDSGQRVRHFKLDFLFPRCIALSEQGNLLGVAGFDKQIRVWDLSKPAVSPLVLVDESSVVHNLVFTRSDSVLISGSSDGTIREWSLANRTMIRQLR